MVVRGVSGSIETGSLPVLQTTIEKSLEASGMLDQSKVNSTVISSLAAILNGAYVIHSLKDHTVSRPLSSRSPLMTTWWLFAPLPTAHESGYDRVGQVWKLT